MGALFQAYRQQLSLWVLTCHQDSESPGASTNPTLDRGATIITYLTLITPVKVLSPNNVTLRVEAPTPKSGRDTILSMHHTK